MGPRAVRLAAIFRLVLRRARTRPGRGALVAAGIAIACALVAGLAGGSLAAQAPVAFVPPADPGETVSLARGLAREIAGRRILDGLDLELQRGQLCVVTGRSGSGKTTLLRLLAGLDQPDDGTVSLLGQPLAGLDRSELAALRRRHVGIVSQESGLVPFLGARENIELGLLVRGIRDEAMARETCAAVGLSHRLDMPVSRLSSGERARVAVARALAARPELLLADEPTSRLDRDGAAAIAELLVRLAREQGTAVVCATHDRAVVERADVSLVLVS